MGVDPDLFVHPERISSQLICPICTQVLENPVQTATEHLFCEDELIEWMSRHDQPRCPVTHEELRPDDIRKPSRIILNMLAELERYCPNKENGCSWTGMSEQVEAHASKCDKRPHEDLLKEMNEKDEKIKQLRARCAKHEKTISDLKEKTTELQQELSVSRRKLKVYDAFFESSPAIKAGSSAEAQAKGSSDSESALQKLLRLRELGSFEADAK